MTRFEVGVFFTNGRQEFVLLYVDPQRRWRRQEILRTSDFQALLAKLTELVRMEK